MKSYHRIPTHLPLLARLWRDFNASCEAHPFLPLALVIVLALLLGAIDGPQ